MKIIPLGKYGQFETMVSDEDYDYLIQWKWNFKRSSGKFCNLIYARRGGGYSNDKLQPTILMHTLILIKRKGLLRPSPRHTVDHEDTNTLNNQRYNLRWATPNEQSLNQTHRVRHKKQEAAVDDMPF